MIIRIDPKIDCVFKAILGMKGHEFALIHFLNAILLTSLGRRIIEVVVLNPFNPKEFLTDKLSIVDIKAQDEQGTTFQIEMQMVSYASLKPRMLYGWSTLYASQLQEGVDYGTLRPVICIWLMVETVFREMNPFHLHFELMDRQRQLVFNDHFALHVIQLNRWDGKGIRSELDRWTRFFLEGQDLDPEALPDWMKTPEMELAMETLVGFREKEENRLLYESRLAYTREQRTREADHRRTLEDLEAAHQRLDRVEREKQQEAKARAAAEQEKKQEAKARATAEREKEQEAKARAAAEQEKMAAEAKALQLKEELDRLRSEFGHLTDGQSES